MIEIYFIAAIFFSFLIINAFMEEIGAGILALSIFLIASCVYFGWVFGASAEYKKHMEYRPLVVQTIDNVDVVIIDNVPINLNRRLSRDFKEGAILYYETQQWVGGILHGGNLLTELPNEAENGKNEKEKE